MSKHDRVTVVLMNGTTVTITATRDGGSVDVTTIGSEDDQTLVTELSRVGKPIRSIQARDSEVAALVRDNAKLAPVAIEVPS